MTDKARELLERALFALESTAYFDKQPLDGKPLAEEIRAYLAEQKQYDALADRYVEGVTGGLEKCREYMETQVLVAKELLKTPEPTQDEEPVSNTDIYPFCGVVKMPEGWNTFANQETDTNPSECIALLEVRLWDDGKECYYKTLAEDLPIGTYELYLAEPKVPFVRLTEEEVTEILTSAYDMYAAICAVENRLVEKNRG